MLTELTKKPRVLLLLLPLQVNLDKENQNLSNGAGHPQISTPYFCIFSYFAS